jgi:phage gp36-like protein
MAYATQTDITDLYGIDTLDRLADRDGDGTADAAKVSRALDDASALIDGYIAMRVTLPLSPIPAVLRNLCVDIAMYRLATDAGLLSEDARQRYEDAVRFLRDVSAGKAAIPQPAAPGAAVTETASPQSIVIDSEPRLFSRGSLRGL